MIDEKPEAKEFSFWQGLLLAEFVAVLVGLATTIIPGKTGAEYGIAGHFFERPTFLQEFLINFLFFNLVLVLLAAIVALWWWKTGPQRRPRSED